MADRKVNFGETSVVLHIQIDSTTYGEAVTGLEYTTSGLQISLVSNLSVDAATYTADGLTIGDITTLGTYESPPPGTCCFKEIDSALFPGLYEVQFEDAVYATVGAKELAVVILGVAGIAIRPYTIELNISEDVTLTAGQLLIKRNVAFNDFPFEMRNASTNALLPSVFVTCQIAKDSGNYAACANSPTERTSAGSPTGCFFINLLQAELNATVVSLKFTAANATPVTINIITQP